MTSCVRVRVRATPGAYWCCRPGQENLGWSGSIATIASLQTRQAQTPATAMAAPPAVGWVDVRMYRFPQNPDYMRNARVTTSIMRVRGRIRTSVHHSSPSPWSAMPM
jgi:hypothetical protein